MASYVWSKIQICWVYIHYPKGEKFELQWASLLMTCDPTMIHLTMRSCVRINIGLAVQKSNLGL